ncbi:hypothetical protein HG530_013290 [Fusarium avenaceum]|nr:hypothetical protein HG530_013290 [Fusarium avenaceum]
MVAVPVYYDNAAVYVVPVAHVLDGLVAGEKAKHDVTVTCGAATADVAVDVRATSDNGTVADTAGYLVGGAVSGCAGGHGAIFSDGDEGKGIMRGLLFVLGLLDRCQRTVRAAGRCRVWADVAAIVGLAFTSLPLLALLCRVFGRQIRRFEAVLDSKLGSLVAREEGMASVVEDMSSDRDSVLNASQSRHSTGIHTPSVHNHRVESRLAVLVRRPSKADTSIALVALTCQSSNFNGVKRRSLGLLQGPKSSVCSGGEVAAPGIDNERQTGSVVRQGKSRE